MTTTTIKKNISKALEDIEDAKFLKAIYDIITTKSSEPDSFELSDEQKAILDESEKEYHQGKGKNYTWNEVKKIIRNKKNVS